MNAEFHINGKTIETERLILRAFRKTDLEDFYEYASVEGTGEMAGWHHHENRETSSRILDGFVSKDRTFAVCLRESGKVIGSLGVEEYGMEDKLTEFDGYRGRSIGYVLSRDYWGRGLMAEAVRAVIDYLFKECDMDFLLCGHFDFNNQSKRVQQKCGFVPYRKLVMDTQMGTTQPGYLNILINPQKNIEFNFSHPETLIYGQNR